MRAMLALVRAGVLAALTYRMRMALSLLGVLVTILPIYFVADALQPVLESALRGEGEQYFAFLVVGTGALLFLSTTLGTLPGAIGSGIVTGTWEALLATPAPRWAILAGLSGYAMLWSTLKCVVLLVAAASLGARFEWSGLLPAVLVLALTLVPYAAIALVSAAAVLAWRTRTPLAQGMLLLSVFLGGVYYPTHVIPDWLQALSAWVPLTYGLRAARRLLLEGEGVAAVVPELEMLLLFAVVLGLAGGLLFAAALRYARRAGTLAQY